MSAIDILKSDFQFPERVYIVGSGTSAKDGCLLIPPDAFVIACNRAIELPINPSIWLVHDPGILKEDWFNNRVKAIFDANRDITLSAIRPGGAPVPVFDADNIAKFFPRVRVVFRTGGDLYKPLVKSEGMMSTRATVAGIALQLAYFCNAKEVVTCGVDMKGGYFDGTPHPQSGHDKVWPCKSDWEWLVGWLKSQGISIWQIEEVHKFTPAESSSKDVQSIGRRIGIMPDDRDIFKHKLEMPETVYILGSGPKGREYWTDIPDNAYVIALNKAIKIRKASAWCVADLEAAYSDWFIEANADFIGDRIWSYYVAQQGIRADNVNSIRTFKFASAGHPEYWQPAQGAFRLGGTVCSDAIHATVLSGAKRIILCGVDMSGDKYYDGTGEPDIRHGEVWQEAKLLDAMIKSFQRVGTKIETLSETTLKNPTPYKPLRASKPTPDVKPIAKRPGKAQAASGKAERALPTVGYLCMSYDPVDTKHAIFHCWRQDYPAQLKTLFLLQQRNKANEFPVPLETNLGLAIKQVNVEGMWPELWLLKLMACLDTTTADYTLWWDEDDCYPESYTRDCLAPILAGMSEIAWNFDCIIVERDNINFDWYRSPIGTMIAKTDILREVVAALWKVTYQGTWQSPKRLPRVDYNGARDDIFRQMIMARVPNIAHHRAQRYYFIHSQACTIGYRPPEKDVDYIPGSPREKEWLTDWERARIQGEIL